MWNLRLKFVEQCKKYIGTPYRRKYHEPGTAEYNSPLFLDCCGLVRRAMRDLRDDFGFDVGPWNQTYMYDTLPTVLTRESQMKPGDLVFISGVYYNQKMKQQLHGIVHIEVWLGEGRKTIGARWHRGAVQIHDSYRFKSTSYHSMRYHFKSVNSWLMGTCKSHCPLHAWRLPSDFRPSKRSVLRMTTSGQQQNASDDDVLQQTMAKTSREAVEGEISKDGSGASDEDVNLDTCQRSNLSSASCGSLEDTQESLMKDILLSGSDLVDLFSEKLYIDAGSDKPVSPVRSHHKSLAFIQVTKSISLEESGFASRCSMAPPDGM